MATATTTRRGADLLTQSLATAGVKRLFTLSGNQIMPVFDACLDAAIELIHVRHEAAAVHMADAWGRLTGDVGVALLTAGPGHANGLSALYTAWSSESPMVLLSGHAPLEQLDMGAFQEMPQAELAAGVAKAAWTVTDPSALGEELARAIHTARSGRPGPVHLSLPFDVLQARVFATPPPQAAFAPSQTLLDEATVRDLLDLLGKATRPLILTGPALQRPGAAPTAALADALGVPVIGMESPRGIADPSLGAFAEVLAQANLVVLLGKSLDFTLRFGRVPALAADCRFVHVDPDPAMLERSRRLLGDRLLLTAVADSGAAVQALLDQAGSRSQSGTWAEEVTAALRYRPPEWAELSNTHDGPLHPAILCRAVQPLLAGNDDAVLIADGGEFGQWAQACLSAPRRVINGPSGAIGSALPFALAARLAFPQAPVVTLMGDGTVGFQLAEFDTAARYRLPFVAVIGNDARWNAEYQIQLRDYGPDRLVGCELRPSRYDRVVTALDGHGEHVTRATELVPALGRAYRSGLPACVNVALQSYPAPQLRRDAMANGL